jgi:tetratricopeptide (TPR) repeat protein
MIHSNVIKSSVLQRLCRVAPYKANFGDVTMPRGGLGLIRNAALALVLLAALPQGAGATGNEKPADPQVDPAPCIGAVNTGDDERIIAVCGGLIDSAKADKADRIRASLASAGAFARRGTIDRAIEDYSVALRLDPAQAGTYVARGELWRKKGDRPKAVQDFSAALKLDPNQASAKAYQKTLALELERLGAVMALNTRPGLNCAAARQPVEKAICGNPDLVTLDRQIIAVNTRVVGRAGPRGGPAMQREQDDFIAQRDASFGKPDYDLQRAMSERLDHLLAIGWN